ASAFGPSASIVCWHPHPGDSDFTSTIPIALSPSCVLGDIGRICLGAFEPLICPNCGADIDVPEGATVMRCSYCSSKLQLKDSGSVRALVLMGEKLDKVVEHTQRTAEGVALIHQHAARTADGVERLQE